MSVSQLNQSDQTVAKLAEYRAKKWFFLRPFLIVSALLLLSALSIFIGVICGLEIVGAFLVTAALNAALSAILYIINRYKPKLVLSIPEPEIDPKVKNKIIQYLPSEEDHRVQEIPESTIRKLAALFCFRLSPRQLTAPIINLVLKGGGVKCFAQVGVLRELEKRGLLAGIRNFAGSSGGGINALFLALGYSVSEIEEEIGNFDWNLLLKKKKWWQHATRDTGDLLASRAKKIIKDKLSTVLANQEITLVKGLENLDLENITFQQLHDLQKALSLPERNLFLTGTNITDRRVDYFSYKHTPDMPIFFAARITSGHPGVFQNIAYNEKHYTDGGVANNLPSAVFEHEDYLPEGCDFIENASGFRTNPGTLSVTLKSPHNIGKTVPAYSWLTRTIIYLLFGHVLDHPRLKHDYDTSTFGILELSTLGVGALERLSTEKKQALLQTAEQSTQAYLKNYHEDTFIIKQKEWRDFALKYKDSDSVAIKSIIKNEIIPELEQYHMRYQASNDIEEKRFLQAAINLYNDEWFCAKTRLDRIDLMEDIATMLYNPESACAIVNKKQLLKNLPSKPAILKFSDSQKERILAEVERRNAVKLEIVVTNENNTRTLLKPSKQCA